MRYEDFIGEICLSNLGNWTYDDDFGIYVNNNNIRITIQSDREVEEEYYYEDWVTNYSDKTAYRARFILKYNGNFIKAIYGALVDGCRCFVPNPNRINMSITNETYLISNIINSKMFSEDIFDRYLRQANIKVEE